MPTKIVFLACPLSEVSMFSLFVSIYDRLYLVLSRMTHVPLLVDTYPSQDQLWALTVYHPPLQSTSQVHNQTVFDLGNPMTTRSRLKLWTFWLHEVKQITAFIEHVQSSISAQPAEPQTKTALGYFRHLENISFSYPLSLHFLHII